MRNGDIIYFKKARRGMSRKIPEVEFDGAGCGILLGTISNFGKDITVGELNRILGSIGLITFDDVGEFLGQEFGKECIKKFEEKYWGKPKAIIEK